MRVIVLGSGVIGVTSAYYLAEAGHEVVVLDRQEGAALETSFANAGEVSPGYSAPWAAPGIPLKALKWLFMRHRPLFIWPTPDPDSGTVLSSMPAPAKSAAATGFGGIPNHASTIAPAADFVCAPLMIDAAPTPASSPSVLPVMSAARARISSRVAVR